MARVKLTKRYLDSVTGPSNGKSEETLQDADTSGLTVRVRAGGSLTYYAVYKRHGRKRQMKLGGYRDITLQQARKQTLDVRSEAAAGGDPAAEKQRQRRAPTVADLVELFWTTEGRDLQPSTLRNYRRYAKKHVVPAMGTKKLEEVARRDVTELRHAMGDTPTEANRVVAFIRRLFTVAMQEDMVTTNPAANVKKYVEEGKERHLTDDEWQALADSLAADTHQTAANIVRLLMLTGARKSEVLRADWSQFDLNEDAPTWTKPSSHTKQKRVHRVTLNSSAAGLLRRMKSEADGSSRLLFPQPDDAEKPRTDVNKPWRRIRNRAGLSDVRMHDLRHTFASRAVHGGANLYVIGKLMGHTQMRTTARYAHLLDEPQRQAANLVDVGPDVTGDSGDHRKAANDG